MPEILDGLDRKLTVCGSKGFTACARPGVGQQTIYAVPSPPLSVSAPPPPGCAR